MKQNQHLAAGSRRARAHNLSKELSFPFNTELRRSIGRTLNISSYHWLTDGGLGLIHWNKMHLLANRNNLYRSFCWRFDKESPSSERFSRNKPGSICMFLTKNWVNFLWDWLSCLTEREKQMIRYISLSPEYSVYIICFPSTCECFLCLYFLSAHDLDKCPQHTV